MSKPSPSIAPHALSCNLVVLAGHLSRAPEQRELPSGDVLVAYEVSVRREGQPTESVPVTWFGCAAEAPAPSATAGDAVVVVGRVRRRFFRVGGTTQSRTEVVAESLTSPRGGARVRSSVERALRRSLDDVAPSRAG